MTNLDAAHALAEHVIDNAPKLDGHYGTIAEVIKNLTEYLADALEYGV